MRRLLLLFLLSFLGVGIIDAQSPDMFNYQAVARDDQGNVLSNQDVGIKISILQGSASGTVVYEEEHSKTTNAQGLVSLKIGDGSVMSGTFSNIDWSSGPYFIEVEMDETGGTNYTTMGTTQLVSVPYAKYAESSAGTFSGNYGDLANKPVDEDGVATDNIKDGAVTESKIEGLSVTTEKLNYLAVDSSRLDPTALHKWLRPTLQWDPTYSYVGINREFGVTSSSSFGVSNDAGVDSFGGMYVNTDDPEGWPFYGYASGNEAHAWHYYDHGEKSWVLEFPDIRPRHRLVVNQNGVMPGGDGNIKLGSSSHRWSEVYATNGTIQTSDRRLKKGIESLDYGLEEVLQLHPVSYQWKDEKYKKDAGNEQHLGLVAQDVQNVIDEIVNKPSDTDGYLGMSYSELIPVLVHAIQEQQQIIQKQEQALKEKNEKMQSQIDLLRQQIQELAQQNKKTNKNISNLKSD